MSKTYSTAKGPTQRQLRVGEMLRHEISVILTRGDLRDPVLDGVPMTISEVRPSPDMRSAEVFCLPLGGQNTDDVISALNKCAGHVRGQLGRQITMKFTPKLRFRRDHSFDEAAHIDGLLSSKPVKRDLSAGEEDES